MIPNIGDYDPSDEHGLSVGQARPGLTGRASDATPNFGAGDGAPAGVEDQAG